jgi:hypothetical protein
MSYWVNIDFPFRSYRLHREDCRHCNPTETTWKGIEELKRDGGWLKFSNKKEARDYWKLHHSNFNWEPCKVCHP